MGRPRPSIASRNGGVGAVLVDKRTDGRTAVDDSVGWGEGGRELTVWRRRSLSRGSAAVTAATEALSECKERSGAERRGLPGSSRQSACGLLSLSLSLSPSLS